MKTVTINLEGTLEQQIDALSRQEGRDAAAVVLDMLSKGLAEVQDRTRAAQVGLSVIYVPRVPFWKMCDFNVLDRVYYGNRLISRDSELFQLDARS